MKTTLPFRVQMEHFLTDMGYRDEHENETEAAIEKWPLGYIFGVQLGLQQTQVLI